MKNIVVTNRRRFKILRKFKSAKWLPAAGIHRPFVNHPNPKDSPGVYWQYSPSVDTINLSVIIPTLDAYREGYFPKLIAQVERQYFSDFEIIVVKGDPQQGRAINIGTSIAKGNFLMTLDDDTSIPDPQTFQKLVAVMEAHPEIGIAGGNNVIPNDANPFVRRVMMEIPRRSWDEVKEITDSDLAEHPCMIMRTNEFKAVGGENELIPRGLDPYLREAFRRAGKRVVVVPDVIYHHLPPINLAKLLRQFYRNGCQAAFTNRNYPQWVIETPAGHGDFKASVPFSYRVLRFLNQLMQALIKGKILWLLSETAYAFGFLDELIRIRKQKSF